MNFLHLRLAKTLMESLPQLILQLSIFLFNFKYDLNDLEIKQIIRIASSLLTVGYGSMNYVRIICKHELEPSLKLDWSFKVARFASNLFILISRVLPVSLLIGVLSIYSYAYLIGLGIYFLFFRFILFYYYFKKMFTAKTFRGRRFKSIFVCLFKFGTFFEAFELNCLNISFYIFLFIENVAFLIIYILFSLNSLEIKFACSLISFVCFLSGILIEIIFWNNKNLEFNLPLHNAMF